MEWKKKIFKLPGKMKKENWILLLCVGLILMIMAAPISRNNPSGGWLSGGGGSQKEDVPNENGNNWAQVQDKTNGNTGFSGTGQAGKDSQGASLGLSGSQPEDPMVPGDSYEAFLENRVKEVLAKVEGVGEVDVLIVLKSSEQKVYQTDGRTSNSVTKEQDSSGGVRDITQQEQESSTVLVQGDSQGTGSSTGPLLEKEMRPEISGIVISAQGGGIPSVKSEITDAMAALFDLPVHKIKVLKRAE